MAQRRKGDRRRPSPDDDLAIENFPKLNESFYGMSPHGYLRMRLRGLYLWLGNPEGMFGLLGEELLFEEMAIRPTGPGGGPDEEDDAERIRFTAIESEVLLHHVSETLLRLYLAHSGLPACPWLELSRERSFSKFKRKVAKLRERLASSEESDNIHWVFHINKDRTAIGVDPGPIEEEQWDQAAENIARFLDFYAGHFLDSDSYNAAKHGLAVSAGEQGITLGAGESPEPFLSRRGPAIEFLKVGGEPPERPKWAREVKWIVAKRTIPLIYMGCNLIEGLWNVGSGRYVTREMEVLKLFDHPPFDEVMKRSEYHGDGIEGIVMDGFSETLLYYDSEKR